MRAGLTTVTALRRSFAAAVFAVLAAAAAAQQPAEDGARSPQGPLSAHNLHPLYTPFIQLQPHRAETVGLNAIRVFGYESYGNNYFFDPADGGEDDVFVILDSEASYTTIGITWGIHDRAEVNASIQAVAHYPGFLDASLEAYHDLFGFPNAARGSRPQNDIRFYFETGDGIVLDESDPVIDITALTLEPRLELLEDDDGAFMLGLGAALKLPLAAPSIVLTAGGTDVALRVFADYTWPTASLSATAGMGYLSQPPYIPEDRFVPWILPFSVSFEWMATDTLSVITTVSGNTSPFRLGYERSDRFTAIATMGGAVALSERLRLHAGLSEEFFTFAATDVALHLALDYRFAQAWEPRQ